MEDGKTKPIISKLLQSGDPIVEYKIRSMLLGESNTSKRMLSLIKQIKRSYMAQQLLQHRNKDGRIGQHPYRKWQGAHWTLYSLAQIHYPPGDRSLLPIRDQVYDWLLEPEHLKYPRSVLILGQEDRFRRCASQEGNAIWYSIRLAIDDSRTNDLVQRLIKWQWPDGGWNCDKRLEARTSSVVETLIPLRALWLAYEYYKDSRAREAAMASAEYFLRRNLFRRIHDGQPILGDFSFIQYPVQFYDLLFVLQVMAEIGKISDPRCGEALKMLRSKQLPDGGFPLEKPNARVSDTIVTRGTYADWGPTGKRKVNPLVTVIGLWVEEMAGSGK